MEVTITNDKSIAHNGIVTGDNSSFFKVLCLIIFEDDKLIDQLYRINELIFNHEEILRMKCKIKRWIESQILIKEENPLLNYYPVKILDREVRLSISSKTDNVLDFMFSMYKYFTETIDKGLSLYFTITN